MLPNEVLSTSVIAAPFLPPRVVVRFSSISGLSDQHLGGVAIGDASQGLAFQTWTAFIQNGNIYAQAPNTTPQLILSGVNPVWVALAFDQNARIFIAYSLAGGTSFYYWFDTTIPGYRTSQIPGLVPQVFASLDDNRSAELTSSDIILSYVRANELYFRAQRDRFGIEYNLGAAPARLVQAGMNRVNRYQFAFQNVQGDKVLPPAEYAPYLGINEPA